MSSYTYDAADRTTQIEHADGAFERFVYDADGDLVEAKNDAAHVRIERDLLGRVIKEWQDTAWVESEYDVHGRRIGVRSSLGLRQAVHRDALGDVIEITAHQGVARWSTAMQRDARGQELERRLPAGVRSQWERDATGRPIMQRIVLEQDAERSLGRTRRMTWRVDDRLEALHDDGWATEQFHHDARGRWVSATDSTGATHYRVPDEAGHLYRTLSGTDRVYGPAGELISLQTSRGPRSYQYDAEGNLTRRTDPNGGEWTYHWNGSGRLVRVDRPEGEPVHFAYDALGRRILKQVGSRRHRWIWDRNVLLHELGELRDPEDDAPVPSLVDGGTTGSPRGPPEFASLTSWIFEEGHFAPMARIERDRAYSVVCDSRSAPLCVLDEAGQAVWQGRIDAWGQATQTGERALCPWRFAGQYADEETGLAYNRFRYYDAEQGRYLSRDPLGLSGGLDLYGYVDDPYVSVDPLGLTKSGYAAGLRSRGYDRPEIETRSGIAVNERSATDDWDAFLGPLQTNIDPRDGLPDPDRIWSADGTRSVRFGAHEMNSKPKKFHSHKETWHPNRVENVLQRIQVQMTRRKS